MWILSFVYNQWRIFEIDFVYRIILSYIKQVDVSTFLAHNPSKTYPFSFLIFKVFFFYKCCRWSNFPRKYWSDISFSLFHVTMTWNRFRYVPTYYINIQKYVPYQQCFQHRKQIFAKVTTNEWNQHMKETNDVKGLIVVCYWMNSR